MSTDMYGCFPWMVACAKLHYDVADELVKGVDLNQKLTNGDSVLHDACNKAMPASIVKYPLQKGVDVNCRNSSDYTPLVCVARTAHQFSDSDICNDEDDEEDGDDDDDDEDDDDDDNKDDEDDDDNDNNDNSPCEHEHC